MIHSYNKVTTIILTSHKISSNQILIEYPLVFENKLLLLNTFNVLYTVKNPFYNVVDIILIIFS